MTIGLDGLKDVDIDDTGGSSSKSHRTGSSNGDSSEYPRYIEEAPFIAVYDDGDDIIVRNEPDNLSVVYRQYNKGSEMKKHSIPDSLIEYWMTDWEFKASAYRYEKKTGSSLIDDLRTEPISTLKELDDTTVGSGVSKRKASCAVCGTTFTGDEDRILVQNKRMCADHTADEMVEAGILNFHTKKEVSNSSDETVRNATDSKNRVWE